MKNNKERYRLYCQEQDMPLFLNDWWLDTVCGESAWEVCLTRDKAGNILGALPFMRSKYLGFSVSIMPDLTPFLGPWICYPPKMTKQEAKLRFQRKVLTDLISQLAPISYFAQKGSSDFQYVLPFHWANYKLISRFTYILPYQKDLDQTFQNFKGSVRTEIRKAEKEIKIEETNDLQLFYKLQARSFARQGLKVPFSLSFLVGIDQALSSRHRKKVMIAKDSNGQIHAGIYLCWDDHKVYNLLQGADPRFTSSGAIKLLLWEGIKLAHQQGSAFDFEGGMMPNIEAVFSSFGAELVPYYKIYKGGNWLFRLLAAIKNG